MNWQHVDVSGSRQYFTEAEGVGGYTIDRMYPEEPWEVYFMPVGGDTEDLVAIGKREKIYDAKDLAEEHRRGQLEGPSQLEGLLEPEVYEEAGEETYVPSGEPVMFPMTYVSYNVLSRYTMGETDPLEALLVRRGGKREVVVVDAFPAELDRMQEVSEDILEDPENPGERRAAEALSKQLHSPDYQVVAQKREPARYYLANELRSVREDRFILLSEDDLDDFGVVVPKGKAAVMSPKGSVRFYPKSEAKDAVRMLNEIYWSRTRRRRPIRASKPGRAPSIRRKRYGPPRWRRFRYVVVKEKLTSDLSETVAFVYAGFRTKRDAVASAKRAIRSGRYRKADVYTNVPKTGPVQQGKLVESFKI